MNQPVYLLDTSPLSVLCGFPINGVPFIHAVLKIADIVVTENVRREIGAAGKMARIVNPLIRSGNVSVINPPSVAELLDRAYGNYLGEGERSCIKAGLVSDKALILDDQDAFMVACRFGLHPIIFQDWIVLLARNHGLAYAQAREIVEVTARQFPRPYLIHTLARLSEDQDAD